MKTTIAKKETEIREKAVLSVITGGYAPIPKDILQTPDEGEKRPVKSGPWW